MKITPEQFLARFDYYVSLESQEFRFRGCRNLLLEVEQSGLTNHHQEIVSYLKNKLLDARENPNQLMDLPFGFNVYI
jgi:hypothetical protein